MEIRNKMRMKWIVVVLALGLLVVLHGRADPVTYRYDDAGRLTSITYANGASIAYAYDAAGNLLARTVTAPASGNSASSQGQGVKAQKDLLRGSRQAKPSKGSQRQR